MPISHLESLNSRIESIVRFVAQNGYHSYDIYDGLMSPIVTTLSANNPLLLRASQQFIGRSPLNLRPVLGIKPFIHTKTASDFISAYSYLCLVDPANEYVEKIRFCTQILLEASVTADKSRGWGLRFPVATRFVVTDCQTCNTFTSVNAIHALLDVYAFLHLPEYVDFAISGFDFLEHKMGYKDFGDYLLWNYWPGLEAEVYNVNGLMMGLCARLYKITKEKKYLAFTQKLYKAIIRGQNPDGSWYYSNTRNGQWIDGFHTGYILEGFVRAIEAGIIDMDDEYFCKGVEFYQSAMFTPEGVPKYYPTSIYPIDAQNGAQAIQTMAFLTNIGYSSLGNTLEVFSAVDGVLWNSRGYYNAQKTRFWTITTPMHRWATGPMILALAVTKSVATNL